MRNITIRLLILMLGLICLGCHEGNKPQVKIEEITPNRQQVVGRLIKESQVPLELGWYDFMPVRSDDAVYIRYNFNRREIELHRYDFDLTRKASTTLREGKGPGEWIYQPEFVGFDNTILMIDPAEARITWFDGQMNIVRTLRHRFFTAGGGGLYSEMVKKGNGEFGLYYFIKNDVGGKQDYFYGYDIKIFGGTISPKGLDCDEYYETFQGSQKDQEPIYEVGEKVLFAQAGDSLYVVDAERYTLTRINLSGSPIRSVRLKTEPRIFSSEELKKWENGFSKKSKNPHSGMWNPTYLYPSPLWPVAGVVVLGQGIAVITCENYNPENIPEMLLSDYFDLDLNYLGVVAIPSFYKWNCPLRLHTERFRRYFRWQRDKLFYIDLNDEEHPTLSRWRLD